LPAAARVPADCQTHQRRITVRLLKPIAIFAFALTLFSPMESSAASGKYALVGVDLASGRLSPIGCVGTRGTLTGFALKDGATGYAIDSRNRLVIFSLSDPGTILNSVNVSGLSRRDDLIGLDVRPATGELYAVSDEDVVYTIDPATGQATAKGAAFSPGISGRTVGFDFNPTVDRIRLVTDRGQNLRLNPDTGQVASVDKYLAFAATDVNKGERPDVTGAGYTNSVAGATSTTLYDIDTKADVLATQAPPNDGTLNTVGSLGYNVRTVAGFDILASGPAYAVVRASGLC
jgi:hypothetical protein